MRYDVSGCVEHIKKSSHKKPVLSFSDLHNMFKHSLDALFSFPSEFFLYVLFLCKITESIIIPLSHIHLNGHVVWFYCMHKRDEITVNAREIKF